MAQIEVAIFEEGADVEFEVWTTLYLQHLQQAMSLSGEITLPKEWYPKSSMYVRKMIEAATLPMPFAVNNLREA